MSQPPYPPGPPPEMPPGGPQQPYPPQYYGPPPAPKKRRVGLILGIIGGVLGLCCVGSVVIALIGGSNKPASETADPPADAGSAPTSGEADKAAPKKAPAAKKAAGIGDPVRDGKFEFTVTRVDCGKKTVGDQYLNKAAQGQFCLVSVTVRNVGNEAQLFSGDSQKAFDADGTTFSNDGSAELYANNNAQTFLQEINPGNQVKGKLVFDVPESTKLVRMEMHDSPFSGGVKVALS